MKLNFYKKFIILLILIDFIAPIRIAQSCGGIDSNHDTGYSFLLSGLIEKPTSMAPFIMKYLDLIDDEKEVRTHKQENVSEWGIRFCKKANSKDIHQLVFKMPLAQMELLKTAAVNSKIKLPTVLQRNSFARHLKTNKCLEVIDYLIYAKRCEPHVVFSGDYWERPNRNIKEMILLLEEGRDIFNTTKSDYVKLRYAYQIIRLAHYAGKYQQVLRLYEELMPKVHADPSIINFWIDGHLAGAIKSLGNNVKASYLFAQIFDKYPGKRISAFRSFEINNDEEWEQCKLLAKNNQEKAALFVIRCADDESKALEELNEIYNLDPKNVHLKEILINEVRKLETLFLGTDFKRKPGLSKKLSPDAKYLVKMQEFVQKAINEKKIKDLDIWQLTDGYLTFLRGDFYEAEKDFKKYKKLIKNQRLLKQLDIFLLALKINMLNEIDSEVEEEIAAIVKYNKNYKDIPSFRDFLFDRLATLYEKEGNEGKSFRCQYPIDALKPNPKRIIIDDLLEIFKKEEMTKLEKAFVSEDGETMKNLLLQLKGVDLMSSFQFEAAKTILNQVPRKERPIFKVNLFRDRIKDHVNFTSLDTNEYTRVDIIEKMLDLDLKGKVAMEDGAPYFYKLGLAYYNISYYGHGWNVMDYFRSGTNWGYSKNNIYSSYGDPFGNKENKSMVKALEFFEKARLLAKSKELAAKATYMASKCRLNEWSSDKDSKFSVYSGDIPNIPEEYNDYNKILATKYKNTKFYQKVIKECLYFEHYIRNLR